MRKNDMKKEEVFLKPLNGNLYNEFSLDQLEERLETDPIMVANILDPCNVLVDCGSYRGCTDYYSCYIDGTCGEKISCDINAFKG